MNGVINSLLVFQQCRDSTCASTESREVDFIKFEQRKD